MDLSSRSNLPEEMDDPDLDEATYRRCLTDLAALNRLTLTHRAVLRWLQAATKAWPRGAKISVLDVAYGQGDLLRAIAVWAADRGLEADLSGVDLNPRSALAARAATPAGMRVDYRTADIFDYVPETAPDFIVTSQFTHHLDDPRIVWLLRWFEKNAVRGWAITDLHRHFLPYYGFRILPVLMGWHRIVRVDGTISIARGFRRAEWRSLLAQAGIPAKIIWKIPFRFCILRLK